MKIDDIIEGIIEREDGYVDHPDDPGGPTKYGITQVTARAWGYTGDMRDLPIETARAILLDRYWLQPKFDQVALLSEKLAEEMADTGVNMGTTRPVRFLQRALNTLNRRAKDFPDIAVDGVIGKMTLYCLKTFIEKRPNGVGERIVFRLLNNQQGVAYMELSEANQDLESFTPGWVDARVS